MRHEGAGSVNLNPDLRRTSRGRLCLGAMGVAGKGPPLFLGIGAAPPKGKKHSLNNQGLDRGWKGRPSLITGRPFRLGWFGSPSATTAKVQGAASGCCINAAQE